VADTGTAKQPKKKALVRKLEKARLAHEKAERKVAKLRVRLERAEARLAQVAQHLVAMQALLEQATHGGSASSDHKEPAPERAAAEKSTASATAKPRRPAARSTKAAAAKPAPKSAPAQADGAGATTVISEV
jgi:hypothetical protein